MQLNCDSSFSSTFEAAGKPSTEQQADENERKDSSPDKVSDITAKRDPHTIAVANLIRQYRELSVQEKMYFQSQIKVNKRLFDKTNNVFLFDDM